MEIFRKGGEGWGGLDPIPNFGTHFFCTKVLVKRGGVITLVYFLQKFLLNMALFVSFWKVLFFPFFVTKIKCVPPVP